MNKSFNRIVVCQIVLVIAVCACKRKDNNTTTTTAVPTPIVYKTDTSIKLQTTKPPVINITDTLSEKRLVLVMKDSAATSERIGVKMFDIYRNILPALINQQKLQITGPRIAWYKSSSPPFFFEAGVPVNKRPAKLPKNIYVKEIIADSAVVAHFYGPYSLTFQAYEALREWMNDNKKKSAGLPYEIYVDESFDSNGKARDPYRMRTDIVFPHK
ncbi:MAG: GyrI-like domain-containing protein [Ferruginibacter sp.]